MLPRINKIIAKNDYILYVLFDSGEKVLYDLKEDISDIPSFSILEEQSGLFECVKLDESRTCLYWSDDVDLPSDTILEYGKRIQLV